MIAALRYEWTRMLTIRSTYWLIGGNLVVSFFLTALLALLMEPSEAFNGNELFGVSAIITIGASTGIPPLLMAYILGIIGVFSMGHEYRHGMIRATLTSVPQRLNVVIAKIITVAVVAAVSAFAAMLIGMLNAALYSGEDAFADPEVWEVVLGVTVYTVLFALAGLALAGIMRNQTAAIAFLLLFPTLIELLIRTVLLFRRFDDPESEPDALSKSVKYLPFDAGGKMFTRMSLGDLSEQLSGVRPLGAVGGGITMAVFVGVLLILMTWLFLKRDA